MLLEPKSRRRPSYRRLTYPESVRFLRRIRRLLPEAAHGRTKFMAEVLGCDRRTARRLLNCAESDTPRLRKAYVRNASAKLGIPELQLIEMGVEHTEVQQRMKTLQEGEPTLDHFKEASLLAAAMAARCMYGYDMPASFAVVNNIHHQPVTIRVSFCRKESPGATHEISLLRDDMGEWRLRWRAGSAGDQFLGLPTDSNFEKILKKVKFSPTL